LKEILEKGKCTKQLVQIAVVIVRFLLSQKKEDLYIVGNATKSTGNQDQAAEAADSDQGFNCLLLFCLFFW
jgi:hypothetical protein